MEHANEESITAIIEVRVTPQSGAGFDRVAARIYQEDVVETVYLVSGGYDLQVVVSGRTLKEVSMFVSEKLSQIPQVTGTKTHFLLKKYKEQGVVCALPKDDEERIEFI